MKLSRWVALLSSACEHGSEHLGSGEGCNPQTVAVDAEVRVTYKAAASSKATGY